jgi:hypothetical protein
MSWTHRLTDTHYVVEKRGHVTTKIEIAREYFDALPSDQKIEVILVAMERVEDHARVAGLYAGPDGVDVLAEVPPCASSR